MENSRYRAFVAAVETGSFSRAAEKVSYTPSGVCQLVNALEKEMGFPLLVRDKKGVRPTADGETVLLAMRDLLQQEDRLSQIAAEIRGLNIGSITISAYSSIATHWLPAVIKNFQEAYPHIHIRMMEGIRQENFNWLKEKAVDLAFCSYEEPMEYDWIPLAEDPMIAVLPVDHPLAHGNAYPLANCQYEKFIMPALGHDDDVTALFARHHLSPQITFTTLENFAAMALIEQGMGMSIMNSLITQRGQFNGVKLPLSPPQSITLGIVVPSLRQAAPAVRRFISYAVQRLGKLNQVPASL